HDLARAGEGLFGRRRRHLRCDLLLPGPRSHPAGDLLARVGGNLERPAAPGAPPFCPPAPAPIPLTTCSPGGAIPSICCSPRGTMGSTVCSVENPTRLPRSSTVRPRRSARRMAGGEP